MLAYRIGQNSNVLITSSGEDSYAIAAHNYKHPAYRYFAINENETDVVGLEKYFEEWSQIEEKIRIDHVKNGIYRCVVQSVNAEKGSALDTWIRMGHFRNMKSEEEQYLKASAIPKLRIFEQHVKDGTLDLETKLQPNEIQLIRITYQFGSEG